LPTQLLASATITRTFWKRFINCWLEKAGRYSTPNNSGVIMPNDSLDDLVNLWEEKNSNHARGGKEALRGFRYQIILLLLRLVNDFLSSKNTFSYLEKISDICTEELEGDIIIAQAKTTLWSFSSVLDELWLIHELAVAEMSESFVQRLKYRVYCSKSEIKKETDAVTRWRPKNTCDTIQIDLFKQKVTYSIDPDPMQKLLELLINVLKADNCLNTVLRWIGILIDSPVYGAKIVWHDLIDIKANRQKIRKNDFYIWSEKDKPPQEIVHINSINFNLQPGPNQLRKGYFAPRALYVELADKVLHWLREANKNTDFDDKLSMLWIGGRSGCGKSVALLHVLYQLYDAGVGPILWLGGNLKKLPEAIRFGSDLAMENHQIIIAIDDPYAPVTQADDNIWREVIDIANNMRLNNYEIPYLICCGPSYQAEQFRLQYNINIRINELKIPPTIDDRDDLEKWFSLSTGRTPIKCSEKNLLLVQLFFELHTGATLDAFAKKFKTRLIEVDKTEVLLRLVYKIIATNMLYSGYPEKAKDVKLDAYQNDAFSELLKDKHFAVNQNLARQGLWFAHPHLARVLFDSWFPNNGYYTSQRKDIVARAILDQAKYGDTPQEQTSGLWALTKLMTVQTFYQKEFKVENGLIYYVYSNWPLSENEIPICHLAAWVKIYFAFPGAIEDDLITFAISKIKPESIKYKGIRLLCHTLLANSSGKFIQYNYFISALHNFLLKTSDWFEWKFLIVDAFKKIKSNDICNMLSTWFDKLDEADVKYIILCRLLSYTIGPNKHWLINFVVSNWLPSITSRETKGIALLALLKRKDLGAHRTTIATIALGWVDRNLSSSVVERVLRRLINFNLSDDFTLRTVGIAIDYLHSHPLQISSSFLIGSLIKSLTVINKADVGSNRINFKNEIITFSSNWINLFSDHVEAQYVVDKLLRVRALTDNEWKNLAAISFELLKKTKWEIDANYSLYSLKRRHHILSVDKKLLFYELVNEWVMRSRDEYESLLTNKRFLKAAELLASMLPLSALLNDQLLNDDLKNKAINFINNSSDEAVEYFERKTLQLDKNFAWPSKKEANFIKSELNIKRDTRASMGKLYKIIREYKYIPSEHVETELDMAIAVANKYVTCHDFKSAGFLTTKILPIAAARSPRHFENIKYLVISIMKSGMPLNVLFGFIRDCERIIDEDWCGCRMGLIDFFQQVNLETPSTFDFFVTNLDTISFDYGRLTRAIVFIEQLLSEIPLRAGLYLPSLLYAVNRVQTQDLIEPCLKIFMSFMNSKECAEGPKSGVLKKLKLFFPGAIPSAFLGAFESVGAIDPWLREKAYSCEEIVEDVALMRYFNIAKEMISNDFLVRSGLLLASILVLSARSSNPSLLSSVLKTVLQLFSCPYFVQQYKDIFRHICEKSYWPNYDVYDVTFQAIGFGSPLLNKMVHDEAALPKLDYIYTLLENVELHISSNNAIAAYHILQYILPVVSRLSDDFLMQKSISLINKMFYCSSMSQRYRDRFVSASCDLLVKGLWKDVEYGVECLAKVGINADSNKFNS
jgi:hypothetical protein